MFEVFVCQSVPAVVVLDLVRLPLLRLTIPMGKLDNLLDHPKSWYEWQIHDQIVTIVPFGPRLDHWRDYKKNKNKIKNKNGEKGR